ncbi:MAG: SUMF1/EgtB/PvdO family nonheme iron enzyme, partial [Fimbriimonas ginsengisoli]|nr:SUMF1/EgtB/PvdO family nonheme iron enzyme [Fimbriimonas ginsengisoli]
MISFAILKQSTLDLTGIRRVAPGFQFEISDWVLIPGGEFWMGQDDGRDEERPVHRVSIDTVLLCRFQVTNADYDAFRRSTGRA